MTTQPTLSVSEAGRRICDPATYQRNEWAPLFAQLRREDPIHLVKESMYGPMWAITKMEDMKAIEMNPTVFSSDANNGGIAIQDIPAEYQVRSFFLMDPPQHTEQRAVVNSIGLPKGVANFEALIRTTTRKILDDLPRGVPFDWVDRVSTEITSTMLAALMNYPIEQRRELVHWSEVMLAVPGAPGSPIASEEEREIEKRKFAERMFSMWEARKNEPPSFDLISILAHSDLMNAMSPAEKMGILLTFLIGGSDTTRNTMTGGLWALAQHPAELAKLRANPALVVSFIRESLRWQTPSLSLRRNVMADIDFKGHQMRKGDKVVLWWISANRDESVIDRPDEFIIDRATPAPMLTFGHGIHRCLGARLAELQLKILWEEFIARKLDFKVVAPPEFMYSNAVRAIHSMSTVIEERGR